MASRLRNKRSIDDSENKIGVNGVEGQNEGTSLSSPKRFKPNSDPTTNQESYNDEEQIISVKQEPGQISDGGELSDSDYEILTVNEYYGVDPETFKTSQDSWCSCHPPEGPGEIGCLDNCENRDKRTECSLMLCRVGDLCGNRAMQVQTQPLLAQTEAGVIVTHDLMAGSFVGQFTGQVMTRDTFEQKLSTEYVNNGNLKLHVIPLNAELVVDATIKGSVCRLASHSCSPNTEITVWRVEALECLAVYCLKQLQPGEVVTFDHSAEIEYLGISKRCTCGSRNCKKILGRTANARGSLNCGACQRKILDQSAVGEVPLHPALATPVCNNCADEYTKVDWINTPNLCRWCCKTGKMVSCSSCPKSFCKNCLKFNLGPSYIKLAEHGSWTCLLCDTSPLEKIRNLLWVNGEPEKGGKINVVQNQPRQVRPSLQVNQPRPQTIRTATPQARAPAVRPIRPMTPRTRPQTPRAQTRGGARSGTPFPIRMLGQSSVSIERVPRPPAPSPKQVQQRTQQTAAIINQLQRYSGLSIQPVSESVSQLENILKEMEQVYKVIHETCSEARKLSKDSGLSKAKERLSVGVRQARSKLSEVESKL